MTKIRAFLLAFLAALATIGIFFMLLNSLVQPKITYISMPIEAAECLRFGGDCK